MKYAFTMGLIILVRSLGFADLRYQPLKFELSTENTSYVEGEKVTFLITVTNISKTDSYPVILPHTQNTGQKLFYLNLYDPANNALILRATEDRTINMMVHDTGSVKVKFLKPLEKVVFPIYWNDFENYYMYHVQNSSHHSFGVPLFAGIYRINVCYNPFSCSLGDSLYAVYDDFKKAPTASNKLQIHEYGEFSSFYNLQIRKSAESVVNIEGIKYFTEWNKERQMCFYYTDSIGEGGSNERLVHITNLPIDRFTHTKNEYFYSHFTDKYAEYIVRFDDGDIKEYRKYRDVCPDELYSVRYNDFKQKIYYAEKLYDGRFYTVSYHQPSGNKNQEHYYAGDGKSCTVIDYIYKKGVFVKTKTKIVVPCQMVEQTE